MTKIREEDVEAVSRFITAGYFYDVITKIKDSKNSFDHNDKYNCFKISDKEKNLLKLVADGMTNEEIAGKLYMSKDIVTNKIEELFDKLGNKEKSRAAVFQTSSKEL